MHTLPDQVLFYDGLCGLCDHLVQFILERDRNGRIFFVPIQSEIARACLREKGIPEAEFNSLSTVYFMNQGIVYRRSRAIFKVFSFLPAPWCFLKWPYVARPIRGQVIALREREFVKAAIGSGAKDRQIIFREILPNVFPSVIVFIPMMVALAMLTESALSFLSIGVQPPDASWGTIIKDGLGLLYTRPLVALLPGLFIVATAVSLNLLGDAVRDALDPKARMRGAV